MDCEHVSLHICFPCGATHGYYNDSHPCARTLKGWEVRKMAVTSDPKLSTSQGSGTTLDKGVLKEAAEKAGSSISSFVNKMASDIGATVSRDK